MGTHISRVKSVDLDAWTDEQAQSMVRWGNKKANKYWEAKLDDGHVPSEGKIDNFVKTKYVSKRWTDLDERPDPEDYSDDDVDVQLAKQNKKSSLPPSTRTETRPAHTQSTRTTQVVEHQPVESLLGLDFAQAPSNNRTLDATELASPATGSQTNISLLSAAPEPPAKIAPAAPRNDLKMSIMSLYASAPKPQQAYSQRQGSQQPQQVNPSNNLSSPPLAKPGSAFDDLNGLFGGMNVSAAAQPQRNQVQTVPSQISRGSSSQQPTTSRNFSGQLTNPATSSPHTNEWGSADDWGGFQGTQTPAPSKQSSAFDDLYSTSVRSAPRITGLLALT